MGRGSVGVLPVGFDITIMDVALLTIAGEPSVATDGLQCMVNVCVLVLAGRMLTCGTLGCQCGPTLAPQADWFSSASRLRPATEMALITLQYDDLLWLHISGHIALLAALPRTSAWCSARGCSPGCCQVLGAGQSRRVRDSVQRPRSVSCRLFVVVGAVVVHLRKARRLVRTGS